MSKVDEAIIRMENNPTQSSDSQSVLEKLLKVDRHVAVVMAFDMLMAGVDTVLVIWSTLNLIFDS